MFEIGKFEKGDRERRRQERERLKQEKKWKKKKEKKRNKRNRKKKNNNGSNDGGSLPRFGEWDESDPSSADGYSAIFDIVRKEKNSGFCVGNLSFKLADQIKTRKRGRLRRFLKSLKVSLCNQNFESTSTEMVELLVKEGCGGRNSGSING
ncbi:unnamed protein product [Linum tenue]|uniref:RIN4 pathogenic type III effector avirulence factor Avr cleavage site domain-containing protein n=1 Tax=Linum tenue TaxID=586396 RepID=A0AAV0S4Y8_9ROSI|nr:unnamed protein product [Linum tenue]